MDCYIDNKTFYIDKADEGTMKMPYFSGKTSCHRSTTQIQFIFFFISAK